MKPCKHLFSCLKLVKTQSVERVVAGLLTLSPQYVMVTCVTMGTVLEGGEGLGFEGRKGRRGGGVEQNT